MAYHERDRIKNYLLILFFLTLATAAFSQSSATSREYHVSSDGSDTNSGTLTKPFKTIMAAANVAMPGDVITVHAGIYREWIDPPRGGTSNEKRITYRAAKGEKVVIKGSEIIKGWEKVSDNVWQTKIPHSFFGKFNPYKDTIHGDWLSKGNWCHTGEVYLNGEPFTETNDLQKLDSTNSGQPLWYCKVDEDSTTILANFYEESPNEQLVEINVRQAVFYSSKTGINYISVRGFTMCHAATPWAPPTAEQIGLIGTHWSKGWIIENNDIRYSKCVGVTLGKYGDEWDNKSESVEGFIKTTERALKNGWDKEQIGSHKVLNNHISHCGQAGIAGSLGAVFSIISGNTITDIAKQQLFWGYEMAGIKLHAAVDVLISKNHIYDTEGGIWLDWMAQGTRVTGNLLHNNRVQDLSLEVNHGPVLIDNNLFLSPELAQVRLSQGVAFINNIIAWTLWPTDNVDHRETPFLKPHSTEIAGFHNNPCGDARFYNNIFLTHTDLRPYNRAILPVQMEGNVYLMKSEPAEYEQQPVVEPDFNPGVAIEEKPDGWYLSMNISPGWRNLSQCKLISTEMLGKAIIPNQAFTNPDGSSLKIETDYFDQKRNSKNPFPGAFEFRKSGKRKIKVWQNYD